MSTAKQIFDKIEEAAKNDDGFPTLTNEEWEIYNTHCAQCYGEYYKATGFCARYCEYIHPW